MIWSIVMSLDHRRGHLFSYLSIFTYIQHLRKNNFSLTTFITIQLLYLHMWS